jgi:hypothetical protein
MPIEMRAGAQLDYQLSLFGIPVRWRTRITDWQPGQRFVDEQESGPYALWRHTHEFEGRGTSTLVRDVVDYGEPLGRSARSRTSCSSGAPWTESSTSGAMRSHACSTARGRERPPTPRALARHGTWRDGPRRPSGTHTSTAIPSPHARRSSEQLPQHCSELCNLDRPSTASGRICGLNGRILG